MSYANRATHPKKLAWLALSSRCVFFWGIFGNGMFTPMARASALVTSAESVDAPPLAPVLLIVRRFRLSRLRILLARLRLIIGASRFAMLYI